VTGIDGISYDLLRVAITGDCRAPICTTIYSNISTYLPSIYYLRKFNVLEKECSLNTLSIKDVEQPLRVSVGIISSSSVI